MIDPANKNIQRYVDSGDYFRDSVEWYCKKFLSPITHRSYLAILLLISILSTFYVMSLFASSVEVKEYPLTLPAEDETKFFPIVRPLSEVKEPINTSVARYLGTRYLLAREEYKYSDTIGEKGEFNKKLIQGMSSRRVFREYSDFIDPEVNADSPQVIYKNYIERVVNILKVDLLGSAFLPEKAIVRYEAIEKSAEGDVSSNWVAEISFSMLDLEKRNAEGKSILSYTVTSYKTYKLN